MVLTSLFDCSCLLFSFGYSFFVFLFVYYGILAPFGLV